MGRFCCDAHSATRRATHSGALPDRALQLEAHERIDLLGELVGQLVEDVRAEAADDDAHRLLRVDAPLRGRQAPHRRASSLPPRCQGGRARSPPPQPTSLLWM